MNDFCGTEFWDSSLTWYTNSPRFTECFEKTALAWTPCFFLWLLTPLDIYYSCLSEDRDIPRNKFNTTKLITTSFLVILSASDLIHNLILYLGGNQTVYPVDVTTPIIRLASFFLVLYLCERCRKRGVRTSGVQFTFWFLMFLFGLAEFRTKLMKNSLEEVSYEFISQVIYYPLVIVMFIFNCFADSSPNFIKHPSSKAACPETSASFLSKILFLWYDSFAYLGYKKTLEASDLWELPYENSSSGITSKFEKYWNKELQDTSNFHDLEIKSKTEKEKLEMEEKGKTSYRRSRKRQEASILKPLIKSYISTFSVVFILSIIRDLLVFANPQILSLLMRYSNYKDEPTWKGVFYAILLFVTITMQTIFLSQYNYKAQLVGLRIRTSLISVIYKKALKISNVTRKSFTLGELVNLMSVDATNISMLMPYMYFLWSSPLLIGLSLFFLWKYLGPSVLAGLAVMLIFVPINIYMSTKNRVLQEEQMRNKDKRIKLMSEILAGMKVLKLYAWELGYESEILKIRDKEMKVLKYQWYLNGVLVFVFTCAPLLVTLVSFAVFVLSSEKNILDAETVFVSISLFNILRMPLTMLPYVVTAVVQAYVSTKRINKFLNSTELSPDSVTHDDGEEHQLLIENGTFTWGERTEAPTLRNINLQVTKGSLVAIVGTVGAGKSSLVSALLGEMTKVYGRVNTKGSIAYVPQQAWIQNATLRENVTFGNKYNSKIYNNVIDSCSLKPDFDMFPSGDKMEIGEKGINLSGGQKQRVSLARAVYSDADNYLLDDPLSAVDAHVGKHIFERVIGPNGLLKNKTRILVTHGITFLPEVDVIVVLKDGTISEVGTYKELLAKEGAFAEFLLNHIQENVEDTDKEDLQKLKEMLGENSEFGTKITRQISTKSDGDSFRSSRKRISKTENAHVTGEKLIEEEKTGVGNIKWKVYANYFSSVGLFPTISTFLSEILFNVLYVGSTIWFILWINDPTVIVNGIQNIAKCYFYLAIYGLFGVGQALLTVTGSMALFIGALRATGTLHRNVLRQVFRFPVSFFDMTPVGRIISRFSVDTSILDFALPLCLRFLINTVGMSMSTLVVICYSTPLFLTVILPTGCLYFFLQRFYVAASRQLRRLQYVAGAPVYSHFSETIQGVQSIRAYGVRERFTMESERKLDVSQEASFPELVSHRWGSIRLESVGNLIVFFAALFIVLGKDSLTPGLVGLSISYALQITQNLNLLTKFTSDVETTILSCERIKEYEEKPQEAEWEIPAKELPENWPDKGSISFENLQMRYREGLDLVLKGLTLTINGGEKVGIVGRTGAGKSSLTLSLFRIIEPAGGRIMIDGVDITSIGLHTLRSKLTIIPQDPVLFSGSLRINLDPLNEHTDGSLWSALRMAHLISHVSSLEGGLQYEVSEGGDNFSVGQRQLICLARALLRKTKILILDEATAAVDLETDDLIQRTIRSEFKDCTVLTIAHRLNTILDSDRVVVLDQGVMIEYDAPDTLLKEPSSSFYKMAHEAGIV